MLPGTRRRITAAELPAIKLRILREQNDLCPLCDTGLKYEDACQDHSHKSGLLRGVLCRNCNGIEGKIFNLANRAKRGKSVKDWIGALILYWIKYETDQTGLYHPLHRTADEKRLLRNKRARRKRADSKKEE